MKDKIIIFIVGLLLGAVISTGSIYFYTLSYNNSNSNNQMQMPNMGGTPPTEQNGGGTQGQGQPPEMPNQNNTQSNN